MIKILTVTTSGMRKKEGISTVLLDNFSRFDREKFEVHMLASHKADPAWVAEFEKVGVTFHRLPGRGSQFSAYMRELVKLMRREKFDAFYIHGSSALMWMELAAAKLCGVPVRVVHSHNTSCMNPKKDRLMRPLFYALYTDALACGTEAGQWLFENRPHRVIRNGRDVKKYAFSPEKREEMRKTLGIDGNALVLGSVGNISPVKNPSFTLAVFAAVKKRRPDAKLYYMGQGELMEQLQQAVRQQGLGDSVVFTGSIGNVEEMLQAMDIMLLPSLHEGLPLVAVEWQIAGLPCILSDSVTRECAYTELVKFIPLSAGAEKWAEAALAAADHHRAEDARIAAERTAEEGFDIDCSAAELEKFFEERCRGGREE